jgi:hypothetical protein
LTTPAIIYAILINYLQNPLRKNLNLPDSAKRILKRRGKERDTKYGTKKLHTS